jgi:hypothetical protein
MSGAETALVTTLLVAMAYTALCLVIPEIRIYYAHSDKKIGPVGSVGIALLFWVLGFIVIGEITGFVPRAYASVGYPVCILGVMIAIVGFYVDPSE